MDRCNVGVIRVRGANGQDFVRTVRTNRFKTVRTKQKNCPYEKTPFRTDGQENPCPSRVR